MAQETITLIKSEEGLGYSVWISRNNVVDLCVLPYSSRSKADAVKEGYIKAGYIFRGVLHEVDMK